MDDGLRQKIHIVWASVFLCAIFVWGVSMMITTDGAPPMVGEFLLVGFILGVVNVPLLLSQPGNGPALLAGGRILLWLQVACIVGAGVIPLVSG
ncbi:MAG: hypothetical protein O7C98_16275 [Planctomycetota bacterium]|nr:hypothetical protein [Planctomycetota bacterium]